MIDRTTRLRWRRRLRRGKHQVEDIGVQAEQKLEKHFFRRLVRLPGVVRFVASWLFIMILLGGLTVVQTRALDKHFLELKPVPGGTYTEGILGAFTNANPLYASDSVNSSVAKLVFNGLFKYDQNNKLVNDLANNWTVDGKGIKYTVDLKPNLTWHDGHPLTSEDVVFTMGMIQNPDAKSPLLTSWQGINVSAPSSTRVIFTLPNPLSTFQQSLTTGLIPKHILKDVPPAQLRSAEFNTVDPIGSGPFKWQALQVSGETVDDREEHIALIPNEAYAGGEPKLNKFIIVTYRTQDSLLKAFEKQEITAAAGLESVSDELENQPKVNSYNIPLLSEVMVFLKNSNPILSDAEVRKALALGTDRVAVINALGYNVLRARGPLLKHQIGYDNKLLQSKYDPAKAKELLQSRGWVSGADGVLVKKDQIFSIKLYTQSGTDYEKVANEIKKQWGLLGVQVEVSLQSESDLRANHVATHDYDALLYGIELGVDPDVYVYWHSRQADIRSQNRLNFSEYKSTTADLALEAGRTRSGTQLRAIKYKPFLQAWMKDNPAVALYQPRFLYITNGRVFGLEPVTYSNSTDRYANVENWMIRQNLSPIEN